MANEWCGQCEDPVPPLQLAVHGRPLSGVCWGSHSREALAPVGRTHILVWASLFLHNGVKLALGVGAGGCMLAGIKGHVLACQELVHAIMRLGHPTNACEHIGCGQTPLLAVRRGHAVISVR